ncbi:hypothetical protein U1Q18_008677 [Sarracenia purpurea var. burkii]
MVGSWDPSRSIPLDWSDGNIWTLELDVPIGKSIQFKFILKGSTGNILWQPGPDRILQTRETKNTILVSEDWDNPELQMLIEEEPNSKGKAGSTSYNSETLVVTENLSLVAENLSQPRGRLEADIDGESAKNLSLVAENLSLVTENLSQPRGRLEADIDGESASNDTITNTAWNPLPEKSADTIAGGSSKTCAEEEPFSVSSMDIAMGENALGNNGKTVNLGSSMDSKDEVNVVSYEGDPVLVPGLTPLTSLDFEETSPSEVGIADEHPVPELDSKKEPDNDSSHPEDSTKSMSNSEKELYDIDQVEKLHLPREQDLPNSKQSKSALKNDIQWGRKTLRKLLTSFGLVSAPKQLE